MWRSVCLRCGAILLGACIIGAEGESGEPELLTGAFEGWKVTDFQNPGKVRVEEDVVFLEHGNDHTGITWTGELVSIDYEITLETMRVEGGDFFCGLTFPVGKDPCSLIIGGWGGTLVGLSSLDYADAYNNETARFKTFDNDTWYAVRLRVTKGRIEAWIDGEKLVDVDTRNRTIGIRWEVEKSRPLGIASWRTTGAIRCFEQRKLTREERLESKLPPPDGR